MRKKSHIKKQIVLWILFAAIVFDHITSQISLPVFAQERSVIANAEISLAYVQSLLIDTEGSIVRIYGEEGASYRIPIRISNDCTVILDHINDSADLTVDEGTEVTILLRGTNVLDNIIANGGAETLVLIKGESEDSVLSANNIACPNGGSTATGARVMIENCSLTCANLGCGGNGTDTAYSSGGATVASASPGSNASPYVSIHASNLTVNGSIACGGNGKQSTGTWSATTSNGGSSGEVLIDSSVVTVGGNISVGGVGGNGIMGSTYYSCTAGVTKSASPVTICNQSTVTVSGNVATQQNLPQVSNEGSQSGLHGVTVTVSDSTLTANDIASGGSGHVQVHYNVYSGSGSSYNIYGTAGGDGGTLIAERANITCQTAVCGGNAGDYMNYEVSIYGTKSGDYESIGHPLDGNGGSIRSDNSFLTITNTSCEKGSRWNGYANASVYSDSTFLGGTIDGIIHGSVITTDMTSVLGGGFIAATDIRNSEEASCAECTLQTSEDQAGKTAEIYANDLYGTVMLDESGNLHTYLGVGKQSLKMVCSSVYAGTYMIRRSSPLNIFQLDPYGKICVDHAGATITDTSYSYQDEVYSYNGDYTVSGDSENSVITVLNGNHQLTLQNTTFAALNIQNTSDVTIQLEDHAKIGVVNVDENARLKLAGIGNIIADPTMLKIGECNGTIYNEEGNRLIQTEILFENPGGYQLKLNGEILTVETDAEGRAQLLLAEGAYDLRIDAGPFFFQENLTIDRSQQIRQADLTLFCDISKGDLVIGDPGIILGEAQLLTNAVVTVIQSTDEIHDIYVEKKDAVLTFESTNANMGIYLPEDFEGQLLNASGTSVQLVTVQTGFLDQELSLKLDEKTYEMKTDQEGNVTFLAPNGTHMVEITIDDVTYWGKQPFQISDDADHNHFSITEDMTDDPEKVIISEPDPPADDRTDSASGIDNNGNDHSTNHTENPILDHRPSGSTSSQGSLSQSTVRIPGSGATISSISSVTDSAIAVTGDAVTAVPSMEFHSSMKKISLLSANAKNTYDRFTRKKITFTIKQENGTTYYYKILKKGERQTNGTWKKLTTDKIIVQESKDSAKGQRVMIKAKNEAGCTIKKTSGFVIDGQKPTVTGVKNGIFYQKKRMISVADNSGTCKVVLNGKRVTNRFCVEKRGIYLLTASDPAGNQRRILFAIL